MPKSASERIASYRERRKAEGMATISLVIPAADAALFAQFAAVRRDEYRKTKRPVLSPQQQWLAMLATLAPEVAQSEFSRPGGTTGGAPVSRAESVADTLIEQIIGLGWPVGMPLGSEPELMKTLGVSRTVLRQAVRLLEHDGVAQMRRGAGGGLVVAQPDLKATTRAVSVFLEFAGIGPRDILVTRSILESATVRLVIDRLDDAGRERLRQQVAAEAGLDGRAEAGELLRFHLLLGELCGDVALRLFGAVALQLANAHSTFHLRSIEERDEVVIRIKRFHKQIAAAILAGDQALAQARMLRYIGGIKAWLK
jgi:DNA-binding FadR family transcriptional regulator